MEIFLQAGEGRVQGVSTYSLFSPTGGGTGPLPADNSRRSRHPLHPRATRPPVVQQVKIFFSKSQKIIIIISFLICLL